MTSTHPIHRFLLLSLCTLITLPPCFAEDNHATPSWQQPIRWQFPDDNPVIKPGQLHGFFDGIRPSCCSVIKLGNIFRMYYWAEDKNQHYHIAQAEAPIDQPNAWVPKGIILSRQPDKPHNSQGPCYAQVIPRDDGPWLMYFCAWGTARPDGKLPYATNLALSHDQGATWQYQSDDPVFPHTEPWNCEGTGSVCVIRDQGKFRAYFTSFGEYAQCPPGVDCFHARHHDFIPSVGIGYAESSDGIHWHYPLDTWVVPPRRFDHPQYEYLLSKPWVIKDGPGYRMWCGAMGPAYRIRSLTSPDGLHWTFHDDWIFDDADDPSPDGIGDKGSFDDIQRSYPAVIKHGNTYHAWYTGNFFGINSGMGYARGTITPNPHNPE